MLHPYKELFTEKLNDMDLVVIEKHKEWDSWAINRDSDRHFMVSYNFSYFLSLPKHANSVLHLLNGGEIEITPPNSQDYETKVCITQWHKTGWYMDKAVNSRIKPIKEKRWLVYNPLGVLQGEYKNLPENLDGAQCVEVEITVTK